MSQEKVTIFGAKIGGLEIGKAYQVTKKLAETLVGKGVASFEKPKEKKEKEDK